MNTATSVQPPALLSSVECIWPAAAALGEGTCWSQREQALYWVDILSQRLHRYRPSDASRMSWDLDDEISAVAERKNDPGLIVTMRRGFALFDPATPGHTPEYLNRPEPELTANRFNDGKCDAQGRFWGGTMDRDCRAPTGSLYRYDPDGSCTRHETGVAVSNGPTWSADGKTMYFNDTVTQRVYAYDFNTTTGALSNKRQWLRFAKDDGFPDGMTTDAAGRLWIAHWGASCVTCHDPVTAIELHRLALPTRHITNVAFGGDDMCTMFITSATSGLTPAQLEAEPLAGALFAVRVEGGGVAADLFGG